MPLSNMFNNRLHTHINSSNKEIIIGCCCQNKYTTSPQLLAIGRNIIACYSKMEEAAIKKNRITSQSEIKERMKSTYKNMSNISCFYLRIIKCSL